MKMVLYLKTQNNVNHYECKQISDLKKGFPSPPYVSTLMIDRPSGISKLNYYPGVT